MDYMSSLRVVLASDNPGKLAEVSAILQPAGVEMLPQGQFGVTPVDEPHATFVENALRKARHASRQSGLPALADDSGLCLSVLNYAPGAYSARYSALVSTGMSCAAKHSPL